MNSSQDAAEERLCDKLETNAPRRSERKGFWEIALAVVRLDVDAGVGEGAVEGPAF